MRCLIQRVSSASVQINHHTCASISQGLLILVGIENDDDQPEIDQEIQWLAQKIVGLRIFGDQDGKMNKSIMDIDGEMIVVSQFTLHASTRKGNRPSYIRAAHPDVAIPLYESFVKTLQTKCSKKVQTGEFGADMQVALVNDGPVTIVIDSKLRE